MFLNRKRVEERGYQSEIFENSKEKNTLVVLPTGLGKTMISALLADYRLTKYPDSRVLFLAPTKPLVNQHHKTFSSIMAIDSVSVSGEIDKSRRTEIYTSHRLIFATPQTIENDIGNGAIDFSDFSLLVVDEAHHAIGNYAYVKIAHEFSEHARNPLILALTASPASDREKISAICKNLDIDNMEIRGEDDPDVTQYVKTKVVEEIRLKLDDRFNGMISSLKNEINEQIASLQAGGLLKNTPASRINRVSILLLQKSLQRQMFAGNKSFYAIRGIIGTSKLLKLYHALNLLSTQSLEGFNKFISKIINDGKSKTDKELAKSQNIVRLYTTSSELLEQGVEHPKIDTLINILEKNFDPEQKAIIFTQYRDTVDVIYKKLKSMKGINCVKFVGQGKKGLSQKEQINIIKDFEAGVYNVLISTSVSEEGMSIRGVDLAIFYETVPSAIRSIQRRGRVGRFNAGKIFILITEGTNDEGYYWVSKRKETRMKKLIKKIKENPSSLRQDGTLGPFT